MAMHTAVERELIRIAWEDGVVNARRLPIASEQELAYARHMAVVHVPQVWPHAAVCRNCSAHFPCQLSRWSFDVLRSNEWQLSDLYQLLKRVGAGEPP